MYGNTRLRARTCNVPMGRRGENDLHKSEVPKESERLMGYSDKHLKCSGCGNDFVFTAGEQEFFAMKGFTNEPRHCPPCRAQRRSRRPHERGANRRQEDLRR